MKWNENESCDEEVLAELSWLSVKRQSVNCGSHPLLGHCSLNMTDIQTCWDAALRVPVSRKERHGNLPPPKAQPAPLGTLQNLMRQPSELYWEWKAKPTTPIKLGGRPLGANYCGVQLDLELPEAKLMGEQSKIVERSSNWEACLFTEEASCGPWGSLGFPESWS